MTIPTRGYRLGGFNFYAGLAIAAFGDVGSAWSVPDDFTRNAISGGGVGLRLFLPYVNLIRLDFAFGGSFQAVIGINEKAVAQRGRVR